MRLFLENRVSSRVDESKRQTYIRMFRDLLVLRESESPKILGCVVGACERPAWTEFSSPSRGEKNLMS